MTKHDVRDVLVAGLFFWLGMMATFLFVLKLNTLLSVELSTLFVGLGLLWTFIIDAVAEYRSRKRRSSL